MTSAVRCGGIYSVVALSNVKKASRPCLARCYLVNKGEFFKNHGRRPTKSRSNALKRFKNEVFETFARVCDF